MKRIILLLALFIFVKAVNAQLQVSFYAVGDADDWQLFMSQNFVNDLEPGGKTVVITFTAGDEGYGNTIIPGSGSSMPYYLAKEKGSVYSAKFIADVHNMPYPLTYAVPTAQTVTINGKSITKYFYGNSDGTGSVVNYFLRLPDGGANGAGFAGTGNNSLKKLKDGTISSLTSVDGSATYTWSQLVSTVFAIMNAERGSDLQLWVNCANLSPVTNPNDYSDHIYSSTAIQEAVAPYLWIGINEYVMNNSANLSDNLNNGPYEDAAGSFNVYNWSLIKNKYPSQFNSTIRSYLHKEYLSVNRSPVGNGPLPITLLSFTGSLKGNNVLLEWSTSSESNSKEFQLEKSNDGINYRRLYTIPAAGNSSVTKKYSYLDIEATELNYYRLKMVDIDAANKLSDVVIVKNNGSSQAMHPLTNPFKDYISVRFAKIPKGEVNFKLVDISGKIISTSKVYNPASSIIRFDLNRSLSNGVYILQAENEGVLYTIKVLKN